MHFSKRILIVLMSSAILSLAGCGDDKPSSRSNREFGKGIDQILYTLGRAELSINIGNASGISEHLQRTVDYIPNKSKDKIERVIDGSNFKLKINGIDALVPVSSQENIDHEQTISEDSQACKLSGLSKVVGEATSLDLRFNWNLKLRLEGSNCDLFIPKYQAVLAAELGRFNLSVVKSLLDSSDLAIDDQRQIELNLTMSGESN